MSLELTSNFDASLLAFLYKSCCSYAVFLKHNFQKKTLKMGLYRNTVNPSLTLIQVHNRKMLYYIQSTSTPLRACSIEVLGNPGKMK